MAGENLYHIKRTVNDIKNDPTGATQKVAIRSTFTDLAAAKAAARTALIDEGYEKAMFEVYDVKDGSGEWKHPDGLQVFAQVTDGENLTVAIETTPNDANLEGNADGKVEGPLFHILQTTVHYNLDRSGGKRETTIEGTYKGREEAAKKAASTLLDEDVKKTDFAEYDEFSGQKDWAYGEDVLVHAVAVGGENYLVAVVKS
ncbi:uncharacterized protein BDZ99DRAFT_52667 [Mytilinidion resinicola]|uniref:Uncharacterized protein n=1 Tax=Mytilinidion resinicola TaxID=574789 RepID=A0A6A6YHN2_9PEZI|nr:uncharacterized protein BDZ99DRAFT_52667 [Mytilinidion resinicola]KAF2808332.1 hypothetical protein BDZ99DRAFT_52667 [Mytilinidion resinicola]